MCVLVLGLSPGPVQPLSQAVTRVAANEAARMNTAPAQANTRRQAEDARKNSTNMCGDLSGLIILSIN